MGYETRVLTTGEHDAWAEYFERLAGVGPYHDPRYVAFLEEFGQGGERAELFVLEADDADAFVYHPYMVRSLEDVAFADDASVDLSAHADIVSSWYYGGPLCSAGQDDGSAEGLPEAFAREFADHCAENGIVAEFIRFDPNRGNHETFACLEPRFERETVPVDLSQSVDELWEGFERRNRNAIRQGQDSGIVVESSRVRSDVEAFYDIYANAMDAVDASDHYRFPSSFFTSLIEDRDLTTFLVATYEEEVVGGSVIVHNDHVAHDYLRASNPDYWDRRINNLLCHAALMAMRDRGCDTFDFQGGRPGVFKFKKGFSPDRREFHVGRRVHLPDVYDRLVDDAKRINIDTTGDYFPAYRVAKSN